ncbi:MAG: hypothetical protein WEB88_08085 [Gemmatimonadota bacterium]
MFETEPGREYRVIAVFTGEDESAYGEQSEPLRAKALQRASELGADAVIVTVSLDNGLPIQIPSMIPGVATEGGSTTFETVTRIEVRMIVWTEGVTGHETARPEADPRKGTLVPMMPARETRAPSVVSSTSRPDRCRMAVASWPSHPWSSWPPSPA